MAIQDGDFVKINFTGKIKNTDEIYSTTIEEVAHEADIYNANGVYRPSTTVVGSHQVYGEIEEAMVGCDVGDKFTVEVPCENAYGQRDPKLIKTMHVREFRKYGITPSPGVLFQTEDGSTGKILTVNGGRVRVDFNNNMAGKDLVCEIEICEIIEDVTEKIKGLIDLRYASPTIDIEKAKIDIEDDVVNIVLDPMSKFDQQSYQSITLIRFNISRDIYENIEGINQVNFIDEFAKPEENTPDEEVSESENSEE